MLNLEYFTEDVGRSLLALAAGVQQSADCDDIFTGKSKPKAAAGVKMAQSRFVSYLPATSSILK